MPRADLLDVLDTATATATAGFRDRLVAIPEDAWGSLARSTNGDDATDPTLTPMLVELYQRRAPASAEDPVAPHQSTGDHDHEHDLTVGLLVLSGRTP